MKRFEFRTKILAKKISLAKQVQQLLLLFLHTEHQCNESFTFVWSSRITAPICSGRRCLRCRCLSTSQYSCVQVLEEQWIFFCHRESKFASFCANMLILISLYISVLRKCWSSRCVTSLISYFLGLNALTVKQIPIVPGQLLLLGLLACLTSVCLLLLNSSAHWSFLRTDVYFFPCYSCGNPRGQVRMSEHLASWSQFPEHRHLCSICQVQNAVSFLRQHNVQYGQLWFDIEGTFHFLDACYCLTLTSSSIRTFLLVFFSIQQHQLYLWIISRSLCQRCSCWYLHFCFSMESHHWKLERWQWLSFMVPHSTSLLLSLLQMLMFLFLGMLTTMEFLLLATLDPLLDGPDQLLSNTSAMLLNVVLELTRIGTLKGTQQRSAVTVCPFVVVFLALNWLKKVSFPLVCGPKRGTGSSLALGCSHANNQLGCQRRTNNETRKRTPSSSWICQLARSERKLDTRLHQWSTNTENERGG